MKTKKLILPAIFLAVTIIAYAVATVIFCYKTEPEVTSGEFPFSITYEYKGEIKTLSGIYKCEYSGSRTIFTEHDRFWEGTAEINEQGEFEFPNAIDQNEGMTLALQENMSAGYFMGDPLYKDYYKEYGLDDVEPLVEYYNYESGITSYDENAEEVFNSIGFKIIDFSYPEPIENSFSFAGVKYSGDNVTIFVIIMLVFLLLCMIFVRKDKEYKYSLLDKIGIAGNFAMGIFAVPFITIVCAFYEIVGGGSDIFSQFAFSIPPISVLCVALSVVLRRTGFSRSGFYVQFGGILLFALFLIV